MSPTFEGFGPRTIFFQRATAEEELKTMRIPLENVEFRGAKLSAELE